MTTPRRPLTPLRTRHFDVAADDDEAVPITFRYKGVVYRCRGAVPALPLLRGARAQMAGGLSADVAEKIGLELLEALFEEGELERLMATGITMTALTQIAEKVLEMHGYQGEGGPPATGAGNSEHSSTPST